MTWTAALPLASLRFFSLHPVALKLRETSLTSSYDGGGEAAKMAQKQQNMKT